MGIVTPRSRRAPLVQQPKQLLHDKPTPYSIYVVRRGGGGFPEAAGARYAFSSSPEEKGGAGPNATQKWSNRPTTNAGKYRICACPYSRVGGEEECGG